MKQIVGMIDGKLVIDGKYVDLPRPSNNIRVTQYNGNVYVNGFKWVDGKWKRTLDAIWHWLF